MEVLRHKSLAAPETSGAPPLSVDAIPMIESCQRIALILVRIKIKIKQIEFRGYPPLSLFAHPIYGPRAFAQSTLHAPLCDVSVEKSCVCPTYRISLGPSIVEVIQTCLFLSPLDGYGAFKTLNIIRIDTAKRLCVQYNSI